MKAYFVRTVSGNEMVSAWEGRDGKARAEELVSIHNRFYPNTPQYVSEEIV